MSNAYDERRAARRALLKQHHPDLGGDTETFVEVLAALQAPGARGTTGPSSPTPVVGTATGAARRRRTAVRRVQTRLPRVLPGARRFATY